MNNEIDELLRLQKREHEQPVSFKAVAASGSSEPPSQACIEPHVTTKLACNDAYDAWFVVDPELPDGFSSCPNGDRNAQEVARWWDWPYAVTRDDGTLDVYCLDGGAWDRATWYGSARTFEEALQLAAQESAKRRRIRSLPIFRHQNKQVQLARPPQDPFDSYLIIAVFDTMDEAIKWYAENYPEFF